MKGKYKILAFITMMKFHRSNSMIYNTDTRKELSKSFGISPDTFTKYFDKALKKGLIKSQGEHFYAVNLPEALQLLNISNSSRHIKFFNKVKYNENITFWEVYRQIEDSISIMNFYQQKFYIDKKNQDIDIFYTKRDRLNSNDKEQWKEHLRKLKRLTKKAEKMGLSTEDYIKSIKADKYREYIKTGSGHLGRLLGCSRSSGNIILKRLAKSNKVTREIIKVKYNVKPLHEIYNHLRGVYPSACIIPYDKGFIVNLGSRITLDTNYINNCYNPDDSLIKTSGSYPSICVGGVGIAPDR